MFNPLEWVKQYLSRLLAFITGYLTGLRTGKLKEQRKRHKENAEHYKEEAQGNANIGAATLDDAMRLLKKRAEAKRKAGN